MVNYLEPDHFSVETALDHRLSGMAIAWRQHPQREKASGVSSRVVDSNQPSNYAFMNKSNAWNLEVSFFMSWLILWISCKGANHLFHRGGDP